MDFTFAMCLFILEGAVPTSLENCLRIGDMHKCKPLGPITVVRVL